MQVNAQLDGATIRTIVKVLEPTVAIKLPLMRRVTQELNARYGTQQVAADAMEVARCTINAIYLGRHEEVSLVLLIQICSRLGKKVTVLVE